MFDKKADKQSLLELYREAGHNMRLYSGIRLVLMTSFLFLSLLLLVVLFKVPAGCGVGAKLVFMFLGALSAYVAYRHERNACEKWKYFRDYARDVVENKLFAKEKDEELRLYGGIRRSQKPGSACLLKATYIAVGALWLISAALAGFCSWRYGNKSACCAYGAKSKTFKHPAIGGYWKGAEKTPTDPTETE